MAYLGDSLLAASLLGQRPAPKDGSPSQPERKPLLGRERDDGLGACLGQLRLPPKLMELGGKHQGVRQAMGVRHLLGQGKRLLASLAGLIRIAQIPQDPGQKRKPTYARVQPIQIGMGVMLLRIIEGQHLLQVGTGDSELAQKEQRRSQQIMSLHEELRVLRVLSQAEQPLTQLMCRFVLRTQLIKHPQSQQH